jgi:hypothetical protein
MSKQLEHVVFFNLGELDQEQENKLQDIIQTMRSIPGVLDLSFDKNISPSRAQGKIFTKMS